MSATRSSGAIAMGDPRLGPGSSPSSSDSNDSSMQPVVGTDEATPARGIPRTNHLSQPCMEHRLLKRPVKPSRQIAEQRTYRQEVRRSGAKTHLEPSPMSFRA